MAVYVDALRNWGGSKLFRWKWSCHLYADTLEELHRFAAQIGMKRAWFQDHARLPHYDLTAKRRARAIRLGVVEETTKEMVQRLQLVKT